MVRVKNCQYIMISSRRSLLRGFKYKVSVMHDFKTRYNPFTRIMTFYSEAEAARCMDELGDARGVVLSRHGRKIKVRVPKMLILHIE